MTVRPALGADVFAIAGLIEELYQASPYVGIDEVDAKLARSTVMQCIQRDGLKSAGGSLVLVSEVDGKIRGFIIGLLDRVYHVGTKLMATDLFFYNAPDGHPKDGIAMLDRLIAWAEANPRVIEIKLGAVNTVGDYARTERLFQRRGFKQCGVIYDKRIDRPGDGPKED